MTALIALALAAQAAPPPAEPITQKDLSAREVIATPASDLNLKKGEIPQLLIDAQNKPYDLSGLNSCPRLVAAVTRFDRMLGNDLDIAAASHGKIQPGHVAQEVVASFIPFRGVIREVSGASSQQRKLQAAITAGVARRSYLKGVGLQRGCPYPARPASPQDAASVLAQQAAADPKDKDKQAAAEAAAEAARPQHHRPPLVRTGPGD